MLPASNRTTTDTIRLATVPDMQRFDVERDSQAEKALLGALELSHRNTSRLRVLRPEDVYFDAQARVQGKYILTASALAQLCSRLLPGLSQTVSNLSGTYLTDEELATSQLHDPVLALRWINDAIKLRFKRLDGYSLVVDQAMKRIEGIVGKKYAFLPNLELYHRAKTFVAGSRKQVVFSEAALHGRRLMMRFKDGSPMFVVERQNVKEPFFGGFHFANSETGDCSVKASAVVIRQYGNTKAISEFADGSKIAHVKGKAFETRFTELLARVRLKSTEITKYKEELMRLMQQPLGLGVDEESTEKRVKSLESQLLRQGLSSDFCHTTVRHVMFYGSYKGDQADASKEPLKLYATRTAYDLYNAITYRSKSLMIEDQEQAEQVAYKMLTGKFHIH
jgi:hypothetical protein